MADWPIAMPAIQSGSCGNTSLTAPGSTNTKGSWQELIASTTHDTNYAIFQICRHYYVAQGYLVDFGIGGSGSETALVSNIGTGLTNQSTQYESSYFAVPLHIPAGTRISVRYQATALQYLIVCVSLFTSYGGLSSGYAGTVDYGADTSSSAGTAIDPGTTANTYGSWVEMTSSTANTLHGILINIPYNGNSSRTTATWTVQVGIGSSGSEEVIIDNYYVACRDDDDLPKPIISPFLPVKIPAGTRIAVRAQCTINIAGDRLIDCIIHGVY
jgi:hypothetical protein